MSLFNPDYWSVSSLDLEAVATIQSHIDNKTKPVGALGQLEALAKQIALAQWQGDIHPLTLRNPTLIVFAADHGIARHNVSIAPQAVTRQMVENFLAGGAAINCFCQANHIHLKVVDAGMLSPIEGAHPAYINKRLGPGSEDISVAPAMTEQQSEDALLYGAQIAQQQIDTGADVIGFGEMGIGNTSMASALVSTLTGQPVNELVGTGTGIDAKQLALKYALLQKTLARIEKHCQSLPLPPALALQQAGGFEVGQIAGAMLATAQARKLILVDGFIVSAAALLATKICPAVRDYMIFCHQSAEQGHRRVLQQLNATPLLDIGLRLGEGTGAAVALPLLTAATAFYNQMATFESARVVL